MTGKVTNCINKGKIYGDLNLGGIAGSMSKENNLDPEDDLALDNDNATLNFRYKERIVIRSCQNTASVEGKKIVSAELPVIWFLEVLWKVSIPVPLQVTAI